MVLASRRIPPPLQLEDDNTRYGRHLLQSRIVEKDSFFAQVYETDWRKLIIIVASINLIRYFFAALLVAFSFNDWKQLDDALHSRKRTAMFTAVGLMYAGATLTEVFGIIGIALRRLRIIRIYVHLAFASALIVTGNGILVAFAYFEFAEDVVNQCIAIASSGKIVVKLLYQRNMSESHHRALFTAEDAQMQCYNAWASESSSQILYVFAFYFLPSAFVCFLVYTYYRQCIDPYHPATLCSQMVSESGKNYTRVPPAEDPSPYFSPLYLNMIHPQQHISNANANSPIHRSGESRSSAGYRSRRNLPSASSGYRSARRSRVNWFARTNNSRTSLNSSALSVATLSPGLPSYGRGAGGAHLGFAYEMPYGQGLYSGNSEGKYASRI
ncbi:hypothetical protein D9757_012056 [Collybiopsis confluens]|uniref:Transmembrane protein n=1 Tax=Collybiopsis confluens TaxID=2823264 RepID=A0A8H5D0W4_9AGAR|nr:hypothetical protein D9757_012056 [Collybiopsis confluens]